MDTVIVNELKIAKHIIDKIRKNDYDFHFGIRSRDNKLILCKYMPCKDCEFYNPEDDKSCVYKMISWICGGKYNLINTTPNINLPKDIETDTLILVKNGEEDEWEPRYFSHITDKGKLYCFNGGATSKTTNIVADWEYAKLPEDNQCKIDTGEKDADIN